MTELLLDALAAWRLTRLLQRDEITRPARNAVIEWTLDGDHPQIRYLVSCPHCLSVWLTVFVLAVKHVPGGRALRNLLAVAGAVSAFSEMGTGPDRNGTSGAFHSLTARRVYDQARDDRRRGTGAS